MPRRRFRTHAERREPLLLRLRAESGFTLVEILIVVVILSVLVAIAAAEVFRYQDRARQSTAQSNLRSALTSVAAYYDDSGGYGGMTASALRSYDGGLAPGITVISTTASTYCIRSRQDLVDFYKSGPTGPITTTPCT